MDIIVLLLLIVGIIFVCVSWLSSELKCPPPKIVYRYIPKHTLDVQFGSENYPSEIYKDIFTESSPWIGGFGLGSGKTIVEVSQKAKVSNTNGKKVNK